MENWMRLTQSFHDEIKKTLQVQHLAVQFVSLVGRYMIPEKEDQRNIAMQYIPEKELMLGQQHPDGWQVSLLLKTLLLQVRDDNMTVIGEVPLERKTFPEALIELKKELQKNNIDVSLLKTEQPYDLPADSLDKGMFFNIGAPDAVQENIKYRHNANLVLNEVKSGFADATPIFIWPNHFDTGFTFPIEHSSDGKETKTLGLGWAIPDHIVDEPYYYLSFLTNKPIEGRELPGEIGAGEWMMPEWNGAILRLSDILKEENEVNQLAMVRLFLESASQRVTDHFKVSQ